MTRQFAITMDHVEDLLIEWGKAANEGDVHLGVPEGILGQIRGSTVRSATIGEEEYMRIDAAMCGLREADRRSYDVAWQMFRLGLSRNAAARVLRISQGMVSNAKSSAVAYVTAILNAENVLTVAGK